MTTNNWTYEQTVIAFWTYCRIPFKKSSSQHPEIVRIAKIIGRTPSALNMKIGNLGRLDPSLAKQGITGLTHGASMETKVWEDFASNPGQLAIDAQRYLSEFLGQGIETVLDIDVETLPVGKERETVIKQRVGQDFFRNAVVSSYNGQCCISGVATKGMVDACHIAEWAEVPNQRTNPCNGLCLNPFFHRAYDLHLIGITPDYEIKVSEKLIDQTMQVEYRTYLSSLNRHHMIMPSRFLPNKDLLAAKYDKYIQAQ